MIHECAKGVLGCFCPSEFVWIASITAVHIESNFLWEKILLNPWSTQKIHIWLTLETSVIYFWNTHESPIKHQPSHKYKYVSSMSQWWLSTISPAFCGFESIFKHWYKHSCSGSLYTVYILKNMQTQSRKSLVHFTGQKLIDYCVGQKRNRKVLRAYIKEDLLICNHIFAKLSSSCISNIFLT